MDRCPGWKCSIEDEGVAQLKMVYKLFTQMCQISLAFSKGVGYDSLALRDNEC